MSITVTIPAYFNTRSMYAVLSGAIDQEHHPKSEKINFDFSHLIFAEPDGMTVLSNLIEWLSDQGSHGDFVGLDATKTAVSYMDDCGFFAEYCGSPLREGARVRQTTQQFRKIACEDSHAWLDQVIPWCADILGTSPAALAEIKSSMREIFFNISDHSTKNIGCVHVQWYPKNRSIGFSISDFGVGIPKEISRAFNIYSDAQALALAIQEGVSSKQNGRNRGAGLSYLVDNLVGRHSGYLALHSNKGKLIVSKSGARTTKTPSLVSGFYPGTLFSMLIYQDRIVQGETEREDLRW